jgi:hypothetical protein
MKARKRNFVAVMFGNDLKELLFSSLAQHNHHHHHNHHRRRPCYDEIRHAYIHAIFGFGWLAN